LFVRRYVGFHLKFSLIAARNLLGGDGVRQAVMGKIGG
jgi:hypothetical protein